MKEIDIIAKIEKLDEVLATTEEILEGLGCPIGEITRICICLEEMYVNVAHYAYPNENADEKGRVKLVFEEINSGKGISITLIDSGKAFNPLEKADPDITLTAEERQIGGLGIYMVKKTMDKVSYEYEDGKNIFCMEKIW